MEVKTDSTRPMADTRTTDVPLQPDPVIEAYKKDIDRGMLVNNLRRTVDERLRELLRMEAFMDELRRGRRA